MSTVAGVGATMATCSVPWKRRITADHAVPRITADVLTQICVFEFELLFEVLDFVKRSRVSDRNRRVVGERKAMQTCDGRRDRD